MNTPIKESAEQPKEPHHEDAPGPKRRMRQEFTAEDGRHFESVIIFAPKYTAPVEGCQIVEVDGVQKTPILAVETMSFTIDGQEVPREGYWATLKAAGGPVSDED